MKIDIGQILIIAGIVVGVLILIMVIVSIIKAKRNAKKEPPSSILDIDIDGVNESSEFNYGYEKEDTIVMPQIEEEKPKKETKKETKKK